MPKWGLAMKEGSVIKWLKEVGDEITKIVQGGGNILFVGTKKQAKDVVQQEADRCSMYYVVERWLGGTLTNFATIKRSIKRLTLLEKEASEIYDNLTKKEDNPKRFKFWRLVCAFITYGVLFFYQIIIFSKYSIFLLFFK